MEIQWVAVSSHRARSRLAQLVGGDLGQSYGRWGPKDTWPAGEYYALPAEHKIAIKGVRVLRSEPAHLFKRWSM
jgi:hypothetical protein